MSKSQVKEITAFLTELGQLHEAHQKVFASIDDTTLEEHAAAVTDLSERVSTAYDTAEENLDEEVDGAVEQLEALENAKDTLNELAEKLDEIANAVGAFTDKFEEVKNALNEAKGGV